MHKVKNASNWYTGPDGLERFLDEDMFCDGHSPEEMRQAAEYLLKNQTDLSDVDRRSLMAYTTGGMA